MDRSYYNRANKQSEQSPFLSAPGVSLKDSHRSIPPPPMHSDRHDYLKVPGFRSDYRDERTYKKDFVIRNDNISVSSLANSSSFSSNDAPLTSIARANFGLCSDGFKARQSDVHEHKLDSLGRNADHSLSSLADSSTFCLPEPPVDPLGSRQRGFATMAKSDLCDDAPLQEDNTSSVVRADLPKPVGTGKDYIFVRIPKNSEKLYIHVNWSTYRINLDRSRNESILSTILRMKRTFFKNYVKHNKDVEDTFDNVDSLFDVQFMNGDCPVGDVDMSCEDVIRASTHLSINNNRLQLFTNVSRLDKVELCNYTMVGCPTSLVVRDETGDCIDNVTIEWVDSLNRIIDTGQVYFPSEDMIGLKIRAKVKNNEMKFDELESAYTTILEPPVCKWQLERIYKFNNREKTNTDNPLQSIDVRIVSFNILSPTYISSHDAIQRFFPYCPTDYLDLHYRNQLAVREIFYLKPQVFCLQECSSKVYRDYLKPTFNEHYYSYLTLKNSNADEGCATFVERKKFQFLDKYELNFKDIIKSKYDHILKKVTNNWVAFDEHYFEKYHTVYQIGCYRMLGEPDRYLFVLNTHLYFHPLGRHIRLLQTYVMLNELEKFKAEMARRYKFEILRNSLTLICGDFNAFPNEAVYELATKGYISVNHPDWKFGEMFGYDRTNYFVPDDYGRGRDGVEEDFVESNKDNYLMVEGYQGYVDSYKDEPLAFTNFVQKFNGTLDYIYYSNNVKVKRVLPGITFEDASEYVGLPSKLYPSDHISIAADF